MLSKQSKSGLFVVKEAFLPGIRSMTLFTLRSQDSFVFVIFPMASDTGHGGGFKVIRLVAVFTLHLLVFPFQRKACFRMIKVDLFPGIGIMTPFALFAQISLVLVIFDMAGITVLRCFAEFGFEMAVAAFYFLMFSDQGKIRLLVIKTFRIKNNQRIFPSPVFSVTVFT